MEPSEEDWERARTLENMDLLSHAQLAKAYRELTAHYYCLERKVAELKKHLEDM
jgi:hypothetical protein